MPAPARRDGPLGSVGAGVELAALGVALTLVTGWMARTPSWFHALGTFQALFGVASLLFALAVWRLPRYAAVPHAGVAVFMVAAACRALLAPVPPSLSGDLFRYVWEGRVWLAGGDPYRQAPIDPALTALRDASIFPFVNHPQLSTIYPPLAEAGFALVAAVSPSVLAFKLWVAAHDLALVAVLGLLAAQARGSGAWALVYAWNPLVLVEYAGTGHNDPTAMLGLALAFLWCDRRPVLSAMALGWGVLVKLAPLVALPFLWRRWPWRARIASLVVIVPGLLWFFAETRATYSGLTAYWGHWRNNELAFEIAESLLGTFERARVATLAIVVGVAAWAWWRALPAHRAAAGTLGAALVTSPVVHPWYLGWVLLFQPLRVSGPWLLLAALMPLNYGFATTPPEGRAFHAPLAWRWIEYGLPLALAAAIALWRRGRSKGPPGAGTGGEEVGSVP